MSNTGWIKLHRSFLSESVWQCSTPEQCKILITLLCMANFEPKKWIYEGKVYDLKAGQMITSLPSIVERCNDKSITIQKVRTALKNFENIGFLTSVVNSHNRLITITNWNYYQSDQQDSNKQTTRQQQTNNKQTTTSNNYNNYKNYKNEDKNNTGVIL